MATTRYQTSAVLGMPVDRLFVDGDQITFIPYKGNENHSEVEVYFPSGVHPIKRILSPEDPDYVAGITYYPVGEDFFEVDQEYTLTWVASRGYLVVGEPEPEPDPDLLLFSFGWNELARTGLGVTVGDTLTPSVVGAAFWQVCSTGFSHSVLVQADGTLWAFGANADGRTGLGTTVGNTLTPTQVGVDTSWLSASAGTRHSMAVKTDGTLWAFGHNGNGRTGLGTVVGNTLVPTQVGVDTDWAFVVAGLEHTLAIKTTGTLWSFGDNERGETGLGVTIGNTLVPTQVGVDTDWLFATTQDRHSLVIKTTGTLWTFGDNEDGRTGLGTGAGDTLVPTQVGVDTDWASAAAGTSHSVAIKTDGTLWSFGLNQEGQTGLGTTVGDTLVPTQVGVDTDWVFVASGADHSLAIKASGTLWAFGDNAHGETGLGTSVGYTLTPAQVGVDVGWSQVAGGVFQSLALKAA